MSTIELEYEPRPKQIEIHRSLKRFSVLVCHRRFGKTVLCINQLIASALRCQKERGRFAYVAPLYKQAKQVAWDYLKHYSAPIPGVKFNEAELRVDLPNGARITLYGADNPDSLRGIYLDGVVLDEYAQMSPRAWSEVIRPALSDRKGWAIFIGTPMGKNAFYKLFISAKENPEWFVGMYKASETGIIEPKELQSARSDMGEDEYNQEYECSFDAAVKGAYYAEQIAQLRAEHRLCKVPYERSLGVSTVWDLGIGDAMSIIFFQVLGKEIRIVDYYENTGQGIEFYVKEMKDRGYKYGRHILPHDAEVRELGTGKSRLETFITHYETHFNCKPDVKIIPQQNVEDGIQAVRIIFPRIWIDERLEDTFVDTISLYRKEWDEKRQDFKDHPYHDFTSHAADALRYLALSIPKDQVKTPPRPKVVQGWQGKLSGVRS